MDLHRDYYKILQISQGASADQVKRAFRSLALKWHPDRVHPVEKEEAALFFNQVSEAYYVLGNTERRTRYDLQHGTSTGAYRHKNDPVYKKFREEFEKEMREDNVFSREFDQEIRKYFQIKDSPLKTIWIALAVLCFLNILIWMVFVPFIKLSR